jgi:lysozyme family protein
MADTFPICLAFTLQAEGGWSDNPSDPGGCTMSGITLRSFQNWKKNASLTCADLARIESDTVSSFYENEFWLALAGGRLPVGVDLMVFDEAVNTGVPTSVMILQAQVGTPVDGRVGPHTLAAIAAYGSRTLITKLGQAQLAYYRALPQFPVFGHGWTQRCQRREDAAMAMLTRD